MQFAFSESKANATPKLLWRALMYNSALRFGHQSEALVNWLAFEIPRGKSSGLIREFGFEGYYEERKYCANGLLSVQFNLRARNIENI